MGLISKIYNGCPQIKNTQISTESRYRIRVAISLKTHKWSTGVSEDAIREVKVMTKYNLSQRMAIIKKGVEKGARCSVQNAYSAHLGSGLNASTKRLKKINSEKLGCCVKKLDPYALVLEM